MTQKVKNLPAMQETRVPSLGWEDALENGMATHSSILAWRIPQTEEPGGLQATGSPRVTRLSYEHVQRVQGISLFVFCHLDYILKVYKVTKLEQAFGFLNFFKLILFLHQNMHHWICKPET